MDVQKTLNNLVTFAEQDHIFKNGSLEIFASALQQQQTLITVVLVLLGMYRDMPKRGQRGGIWVYFGGKKGLRN